MLYNKGRLKFCILLLILILLLLSFTGCVEKNKEDINIEDINIEGDSLTPQNVQGEIEQLKDKRDEIMRRIKEVKEAKLKNPPSSKEIEEDAIKKQEELIKHLLEQSKELEERIKESQKDKVLIKRQN
jgi:tRNA nucleotidyltransferase/poly(A) polymerase